MSGSENTALRLSVAMCTFNGARYIQEQLDSIALQTVQPLEIVVQDDGSSDDTVAIIARFAAEASFPVRFFKNADRLGPSANFSSCMSKCEGEIVALCDQDDVWMPDRIERTIAAFAADPAVSFTFSDAPLIDDVGKPLSRSIFDTVPVTRADRRRLRRGYDLGNLVLRYSVLYGATMAARSNLLRQVLPLPAGWGQDDWIAVALGALGRSVCMEPVMAYRQHPGQVVGAGTGGLLTIAAVSRVRDEAVYQRELDRGVAAIAAVRSHPVLSARLLAALQRKQAFLERRRQLRTAGLTLRNLQVLATMIQDYWIFAAGPRSVAKDLRLMVRGRRAGRQGPIGAR